MRKKRAKKTKHVFILKQGERRDSQCFIVDDAYFCNWRNKLINISLSHRKILPLADKILKDFVRATESRCIDWSIMDPIERDDVLVVPVVLFLASVDKVVSGDLCVNLAEHECGADLLGLVRRLQPVKTSQAA